MHLPRVVPAALRRAWRAHCDPLVVRLRSARFVEGPHGPFERPIPTPAPSAIFVFAPHAVAARQTHDVPDARAEGRAVRVYGPLSASLFTPDDPRAPMLVFRRDTAADAARATAHARRHLGAIVAHYVAGGESPLYLCPRCLADGLRFRRHYRARHSLPAPSGERDPETIGDRPVLIRPTPDGVLTEPFDPVLYAAPDGGLYCLAHYAAVVADAVPPAERLPRALVRPVYALDQILLRLVTGDIRGRAPAHAFEMSKVARLRPLERAAVRILAAMVAGALGAALLPAAASRAVSLALPPLALAALGVAAWRTAECRRTIARCS